MQTSRWKPRWSSGSTRGRRAIKPEEAREAAPIASKQKKVIRKYNVHTWHWDLHTVVLSWDTLETWRAKIQPAAKIQAAARQGIVELLPSVKAVAALLARPIPCSIHRDALAACRFEDHFGGGCKNCQFYQGPYTECKIIFCFM